MVCVVLLKFPNQILNLEIKGIVGIIQIYAYSKKLSGGGGKKGNRKTIGFFCLNSKNSKIDTTFFNMCGIKINYFFDSSYFFIKIE